MCGCCPSCNFGLNWGWGGEPAQGTGRSAGPSGSAGSAGQPVITAQPKGSSSTGDAIHAVSDVVSSIINSEHTRRGAQACYESCGTSCRGSCCCPGCGCSEGQCGCGAVGETCCHCWDLFCLKGEGSAREEIEALVKELENTFGPLNLLVAERNSGVSLEQKITKGEKISREEKQRLIEACRESQRMLTSRLEGYNRDDWHDNQSNCSDLLAKIPGMEEAIIVGGSGSDPQVLLGGLLVIVNSEQSQELDLDGLAKKLMGVCVRQQSSNQEMPLGLVPTMGILQSLINILNVFCSGGRRWLFKKELLALCALLLGVKGYGCINSAGEMCSLSGLQSTSLGSSCMKNCPKDVGMRGLGGLNLTDELDGGGARGGGDFRDPNELVARLSDLGMGSRGTGLVPKEEQWRLLAELGQKGLQAVCGLSSTEEETSM